MPHRSQHSHKAPKSAVREIVGSCSPSLLRFKDCESRPFVVVKFSMVKTLRDGEKGFQLQGNACNLGNWRGQLRSVEYPADSGHHVVYVSLPKNSQLVYQWSLISGTSTENNCILDKEDKRCVMTSDKDIIVQDCYKVYTSILPQVFQPDCHQDEHLELKPIVFHTTHQVPNPVAQAVAVLGSTPYLGRWRSRNASCMYETVPGEWATIIYLPTNQRIRYKFVVLEKAKRKRILYGQRKEHKVSLLPSVDVEHKDGGGSAPDSSPADAESSMMRSMWTERVPSHISVQHVEERSMGSVASDVSLGTHVSAATALSDGDNYLEDDEKQLKQNEVLQMQETALAELRWELGGVEEMEAAHQTHLPVAMASSIQRCANWVNVIQRVQTDDAVVDDAVVDDAAVDDAAVDDAAVDDAVVDDAVVDDAVVDDTASCHHIATDVEETLPAVLVEPELTWANELEELLDQSVRSLEESASAETANHTPVYPDVCPDTGVLQNADGGIVTPDFPGVEQQSLSEPVSATLHPCVSINTSTVNLPCYDTKSLSITDITCKIVEKLPWIVDLPRPLICSVLQTFGILNTDKQAAIADELAIWLNNRSPSAK